MPKRLPNGAVRIGPDWSDYPKRTLAKSIVPWTRRYLRLPDGPNAGARWLYTQEQLHFVAWWYALDDAGRFVYRRGLLRRQKGWGKDPLLATLCAIELCGPCRYDPVLDRPVGHPAPWVQLAAVSKEQNRNTMTLFPRLFSPAAIEEFGLDIGKEYVRSAAGGLLEAVTSSPRAVEGGRPSFVLKNETQHWLSSNEGLAMGDAIARNLAKSRDGSARSLAITNAHNPGEGSDAERDWSAYQDMEAGRTRATGFLYDSIEADPRTKLEDEASLRRGLEQARGHSVWVDIDRLVEEIYDPATDPATARRFYLNQVVAATSAFLSPQVWDSRSVGDDLEREDEICLGFDGSKSDDATALVAIRVRDELLVPIGIWQPRKGAEVDRRVVDAAVYRAFDLYDVVGFYSDVHPWESYIDAWAEEFGEDLPLKAGPRHAIGFDMRSRIKEFTEGAEAFVASLVDGKLRHNGDVLLSQHAYNARRRPNRYGVGFGKETRDSSKKVDALAASVLARMARSAYLSLPESKRRRKAKSGKAAFL